MTSIEDWSLSTLSSQVFWQQTQLQLQSGNSRFFGGRPNCNLGTRDFLVAGLVATRQSHYCNLGTGDFLGCRPSWKMIELQL